jgi:hypothetical protein
MEGTADQRGRLGVENADYSFRLLRGLDGGPWAISDVEELAEPNSGPIRERVRGDFDQIQEFILDAPVTYCSLFGRLGLLPLKEGFVVLSVTPAELEGDKVAKVEFDYKPIGEPPYIPAAKGWVIYDPGRQWVIRAIEGRITNSAGDELFCEATLKYDFDTADFPVLTELTSHRFVAQEDYDVDETHKIESYAGEESTSTFRLSAYGFPEPGEPAAQPIPWYVWGVGAGIASLIVGGLLRWRLQSRR